MQEPKAFCSNSSPDCGVCPQATATIHSSLSTDLMPNFSSPPNTPSANQARSTMTGAGNATQLENLPAMENHAAAMASDLPALLEDLSLVQQKFDFTQYLLDQSSNRLNELLEEKKTHLDALAATRAKFTKNSGNQDKEIVIDDQEYPAQLAIYKSIAFELDATAQKYQRECEKNEYLAKIHGQSTLQFDEVTEKLQEAEMAGLGLREYLLESIFSEVKGDISSTDEGLAPGLDDRAATAETYVAEPVIATGTSHHVEFC